MNHDHDLDNINTRRDESILSRLSARTRTTLEALLKSPAAEKAIAETEQQAVKMRRELGIQLAGLAKIYAPQREAAEAVAVRAVGELDAAAAAHRAAEVTLAQARNTCAGIDHTERTRTWEILRQLEETADPRWGEFLVHASNLFDADLPGVLQFWVDVAWRQTVLKTNWPEVETARGALRAAIAQARRQQLEPLGYVEVSEALSALCAGLAPSLAVLELNPPSLSAEHVEVGASLRWNGKSVWVLDGRYEPTADDRKANTDDTKVRLRRSAAV